MTPIAPIAGSLSRRACSTVLKWLRSTMAVAACRPRNFRCTLPATRRDESLDMVMNTLENLHNLGRRVGIISHVDTLKERIPAKIQLVREGKSASRVEVVRS